MKISTWKEMGSAILNFAFIVACCVFLINDGLQTTLKFMMGIFA